MKYTIWDLDNCLSDDRPRIKLIDWNEPNPEKRYRQYHEACFTDGVDNFLAFQRVTTGKADIYVNGVLRSEQVHEPTLPLFLTGRPNIVRPQTLSWLATRLGIANPTLLMRNDADNRSSVDVKQDMLRDLVVFHDIHQLDIDHAYDDHEGIVAMYRRNGISATRLTIHDVSAYEPPPKKAMDAASVLEAMAATYRERNAGYKDNYKMVPQMMKALFPGGVPSELVVQDHFHLFELILVKLTRYAASNLTHIDSIHDAAVYAAMCEAINSKEKQ